jgi:fucose permease
MKAKTSGAWTSTVLIAFMAFVGIGLSAGLLGLAWPAMQKQFGLPVDGVYGIFIPSTITYSLAGFFIGRLMTRFGSGVVLLCGALIMASAKFMIAASPAWVFIIFSSMVLGFGNGLIDAGLNLYIAKYHTPQQMNFLHASFGVGITIGPLIMTFVFNQNWAWQLGYVIVGALLLVLALLLALTRTRWRTESFVTENKQPVARAPVSETVRQPAVWFGIITFLAYVGVEIGIGQWAYTLLTESRGVDATTAGLWVSLYWGAFTGGRILWGSSPIGSRSRL